MTERIELPPVLDLVAAPVLLEKFQQLRGQSITVDVGQVQRFGAQCLQVLLAARNAWAADGHSFLLQTPAEEFTVSLELMGLSPAALNHDAEDGTGEAGKKESAK